jgi:amino acid transporter
LRALGLPAAIAMVVGSVIGSGIYFKPPTIAADLGSFGPIMAVWIVGGLLCLLGALCMAELAAMLPRAGGMYVYLREGYGRLPAFLYGWTLFWVVRPAAVGALATAFALPLPYGESVRLGISIGVIAVLAWINMMGVVWGGWMQGITSVIKAGSLVVIMFLPLTLGYLEPANFSSTIAARSDTEFMAAFAVALLSVLWAYNSWHEVTPLAEEIVNPQRNVPLALFLGVGGLIVLYVGVNAAYHGVMSVGEVAQENNVAAGVMERLVGPTGGALMIGVIMASVFGTINANMLHAPRVFFAMARDKVFFPQIGRVHPTRSTPSNAIGSLAVLAIGLIFLAGFVPATKSVDLSTDPGAVSIPQEYAGRFSLEESAASDGAGQAKWTMTFSGRPMRQRERAELDTLSEDEAYRRGIEGLYSQSNRHVFDLLTNLVIFGASIFYALTIAGVMVLRRRRPDLERPYRTWGYPIVPIVYVIVYTWFLSTILFQRPLESCVGLGIIALGAPAFYLWTRSAR